MPVKEVGELAKIIMDYGFTAVFISGVFIFLFIYFKGKLRAQTEEVELMDPKEHYFFSEVDLILEYKIPNFSIKIGNEVNEARTVLFRDMLNVKFKLWRQMLVDVCESDYQNISDKKMEAYFKKKVYKLVNDYEFRWREMGVPKKVIDKFNEWHKIRVQVFIDTIERIFDSTGQAGPHGKLISILEHNRTLLAFTMDDIEKTLSGMNGYLKDEKYKGLIL